MEKKLEKMKSELKVREGKATAFLACIVVLIGALGSGVIPTSRVNSHMADYMHGFQLGILIGLAIVGVVTLMRYRRALADDARLKALYYKENDERALYIEQMTGRKSMNITVVILLVAAVIVGYFSIEAYVALVGAAVVECLVKIAFKAYYCRTLSGPKE